MKVSDFNEQTEQFFRDCMAIMNGKGLEYSGNEDKFANFKKLAAKYNVPVEEIWGVYFTKHIDSIDSFIRKRREGKNVTKIEAGLSEPISGRIADAVNYLLILKGMIDEERENEFESNSISQTKS
jgi:hypothetical protein